MLANRVVLHIVSTLLLVVFVSLIPQNAFAWSTAPVCSPATTHQNLNILMMLDDSPEAPPKSIDSPSCEGQCGGNAGGCYCDSTCLNYGDCCDDFCESCHEVNPNGCANHSPFFGAARDEARIWAMMAGDSSQTGLPWSIGVGVWNDSLGLQSHACLENNIPLITHIDALVPQPKGFTSVAAGGSHNCAIHQDQRAQCWGANDHGQRWARPGKYTFLSEGMDFVSCGVNTICDKAISAGDHHSIALRSNGTVRTWGDNYYGQIGNGDDWAQDGNFYNTPQAVVGLSGVVSVASGSWHNLVALHDGSIIVWGRNVFGQLGNGVSGNPVTSPISIGFTDAVQVAAGRSFSLALKSDGTVWAWGNNGNGEIGQGTSDPDYYSPTQVASLSNIRALAAGRYHSLALRADGTVWAWGSNGRGQIGNGSIGGTVTSPSQVTGISNAVAVAAGRSFSMAILNDGTVRSWGSNDYGKLGRGSTGGSFSSPQAVAGLDGVVAIEAGHHHAIALRSDNTVWVWGRNDYGQLANNGSNSNVPILAQNAPTNANGIAAGYEHNLVLRQSGEVSSWGYNEYGQLGRGGGGTPGEFDETPADVSSLSAAGCRGNVTCWGNNDYGQLFPNPTSMFKEMGASWGHVCGIKTNNALECWGNNSFGQHNFPAGSFRQISVGAEHNCAINWSNGVECWGRDNYNQVINTPNTGSYLQVVSGRRHNCALRDNNNVVCWGDDHMGQAPASRSGPFSQIATANNFTCALRIDEKNAQRDKNIECWGTLSGFPNDAPPKGRFKQISGSGWGHICGLRTNGAIECWGGSNTWGQLSQTPNAYNDTIIAPADAVELMFEHSCLVSETDDPTYRGVGVLMTHHVHDYHHATDALEPICSIKHQAPVYTLVSEDLGVGGQENHTSFSNILHISGSDQGCCTGIYCSPCDYTDTMLDAEGDGLLTNKNMCPANSSEAFGDLDIHVAYRDTCRFKLDVSMQPDKRAPEDVSATMVQITQQSSTVINVPHISLDSTTSMYPPRACEDGYSCQFLSPTHQSHGVGYCQKNTAPTSCTWNSDCPFGEECITGGVCHPSQCHDGNPFPPPDVSSKPCPSGYSCAFDDGVDYNHGNGYCVANSPTACSNYEDCAFGEDCVNGLCNPAECHAGDNDGPQGWYFINDLRTEVALTSQYCADYLDGGTPGTVTTQVACYDCPNEGELCQGATPTTENACTEGIYTCIEGQQYCMHVPARFTAIGSGRFSNCGLRKDTQEVTCWGHSQALQNHPESTKKFISVSSSSGNRFSCGVTVHGSIECWGINSNTAVQDEDIFDSIPSGNGFVQVSAGKTHACALHQDKSVHCWGVRDGESWIAQGQVDDTPTNSIYTKVESGNRHNCALTTNQDLVCWGWYDGSTFYDFHAGPIRDFSSRGHNTCLIRTNNKVECFGRSWGGILNVPDVQFKKVAVGAHQACGLMFSGAIKCWGDDTYGQLSNAPQYQNFIDVSAGFQGACAVRVDGSTTCWGRNINNLLDIPTFEDDCPTPCFEHRDLIGTACEVPGKHGRCAIGVWECCNAPYSDGDSGSSYCDNDLRCKQLYKPMPETCNGQDDDCDGIIDNMNASWRRDWVDDDRFTLAEMQSFRNDYAHLACHFQDSCVCPPDALPHDYPASGDEWERELIDEANKYFTQVQSYQDNLPTVTGGNGPCTFVTASGGQHHSLAVTSTGSVFSWGSNYAGQLGHGTTGGYVYEPTEVLGLTDIIHVAAGSHYEDGYGLAVDSSGQVYSWGSNAYGQLGNGSHGPGTNTNTPAMVLGIDGIGYLDNAIAVAASEFHGLALLNDGTVAAWGLNSNGQLGDNSVLSPPVGPVSHPTANPIHNVPVQVRGIGGVGYLDNIIAVAAGREHSIALRANGTVVSWGFNAHGVLGYGSSLDNTSTPVAVKGVGGSGSLTNVTAISTLMWHNLALLSDGSVVAWGLNHLGRLGNGNTTTAYTPVEVLVLSGITAVSAGYHHSAAVTGTGEVYTWGQNTHGELGLGTVDPSPSPNHTPQLVPGVSDAVAVYAGRDFTLGLNNEGNFINWGDNSMGQLGIDVVIPDIARHPYLVVDIDDAQAIAANSAYYESAYANTGHSLAIRSDGSLYAWGLNNVGQLGLGNSGGSYGTPQRVQGVNGSGYLSDVVAIAAGDMHSYALHGTQALASWGRGNSGQLGIGNTSSYHVPRHVDTGFSLISSGTTHGLAITTDLGYSWGLNGNRQLGRTTYFPSSYSTTPYNINSIGGFGTLSNVSDVKGGARHSIALTNDGEVVSWGHCVFGQLGRLCTNGANYVSPDYVNDVGGGGVLESVSQIHASSHHNLAILNDSSVVAWGINQDGQLGDNSTTTAHAPIPVHGIGGVGYLSGITAVSAGAFHSIALRSDGTVVAWGNNDLGQLGNNTTNDSLVPVQVVSTSGDGLLQNVIAISAGRDFNLALLDDGRIASWGRNEYGQLGLGDHTDVFPSPEPMNFSGCSVTGNGEGACNTATTISAGYGHSMAIQNDGQLYTWGSDGNVQLGHGGEGDESTPRQVDYFSGQTLLRAAAGSYHSMAVTSNGQLYTWGQNSSGQLGHGGTTPEDEPRVVDELVGHTVTFISGGRNYSMAITSDGNIYTWGANAYGQLGHGGTVPRDKPRLVDELVGKNVVLASGSIAGIDHFTLAVTQSGELYTWGANTYEQLGHGATGPEDKPRLVDELVGETVLATAAGGFHSMAITDTGELYTWGNNWYGQLGHGDTTQRNKPSLVNELVGKHVVAIAAGGYHSMAVTVDGALYTWGWTAQGVLGRSTTPTNLPVIVDGLIGQKVVSISAEWFNSMALTDTGELHTWGVNTSGQLGRGTPPPTDEPGLVSGFEFALCGELDSGDDGSPPEPTGGTVRPSTCYCSASLEP